MKVLDKMINEFTKSTKTGFNAYVKTLTEIRVEFESLNLSNHTLQIDNDHKQDVINGLDAEMESLSIIHNELMNNFNKSVELLKLEESRTWWNKLWGTYPKVKDLDIPYGW